MPRIEGAHEFVKADAPDVMECKHCGMKAVTNHFKGVENMPCSYGAENFTREE